LFGYNYGVRFEKNKHINYPTPCGGIISILLKMIVLYILYKACKELINSETEITSTIRRHGVHEYVEVYSNDTTLSSNEEFIF